ncbi:hypothetical protein O6H91_11G037400 [Diphasiastrum complanatum]|uniref:Uncharacterized protein n=1 Tax=Diphasiastrum complanatum TaxID=34168 RepID=A0ACC2C851_DIPCM|nr:hypothetical protein O6H91_11G037400 [Diphasiastrum complanatum]
MADAIVCCRCLLQFRPPTILRVPSSSAAAAALRLECRKGAVEAGCCCPTAAVSMNSRSALIVLCNNNNNNVGKNKRDFLTRASSNVEEAANYTSAPADSEREDLAAKLAAAEAEAKALRKELATRKGGKDVDLSKLKPAIPENRIDGTGYRETLLSFSDKPSEGDQKPNKWGLSEAELFLSKGAPTEGMGLNDAAIEAETKDIVRRRLLLGLGFSLVAVGLAFFKLPAGFIRPSKPLFIYLIPIIQLKEQLKNIETTDSDAKVVQEQLQKLSDSANVLKDTLLSAAAWLDESDADRASSLAYEIFEFLDQVDYNNYYESFGKASATQQLEFLRFSLQSVKGCSRKGGRVFVSCTREALVAAQSQLQSRR